MKRLVLGILAHVDAGKTTLSEALLYTAGAIPALGRVDHRDAHLDTHALERARGITIFSKQAVLELGDTAAPPAMFSMMHYARFPHRVQAPAEVLPAESDPCVNGFCDFYEFSFSRCGKPWASYRSYGFSSRFLLTAARSCAKLCASKQKGRVDRCDWFFPYVPQCFRAGCLRCIFLP